MRPAPSSPMHERGALTGGVSGGESPSARSLAVGLQTMRLNLDAVATWWVGTTASPFEGNKDAGGFVGVAIPLG
jgi:hypothetical protein